MKINIRTENEAFKPHPAAECARILRVLADDLTEGRRPYPARGEVCNLYDVNGNKVGTYRR